MPDEERRDQDGLQCCSSSERKEGAELVIELKHMQAVFVFDPFRDWETGKLLLEGCAVFVTRCFENKTCSGILDFLQWLNNRVRSSRKERIGTSLRSRHYTRQDFEMMYISYMLFLNLSRAYVRV